MRGDWMDKLPNADKLRVTQLDPINWMKVSGQIYHFWFPCLFFSNFISPYTILFSTLGKVFRVDFLFYDDIQSFFVRRDQWVEKFSNIYPNRSFTSRLLENNLGKEFEESVESEKNHLPMFVKWNEKRAIENKRLRSTLLFKLFDIFSFLCWFDEMKGGKKKKKNCSCGKNSKSN